MSASRYVSSTRDRFKRPKNTKRWYRCACGRWWGKNKHFLCVCGAAPPSFRSRSLPEALDWLATGRWP